MSAPRWPDLFVVGAMKAGTTSLHRWLDAHPAVFMSRMKEPHFFAQVASVAPGTVVREEAAYLALFADAGAATVLGESSTSYLWDERAAQRIAARVPDARIVAVLRDPVERAWSHYLMDVRYGHQSLSFLDALIEDREVAPRRWGPGCHLYIDLGMYARQLRRYFDAFGRERVLILEFDDLRVRTPALLGDVARFLGIDADGFAAGAERAHNPYLAPRGALTRLVARNHRLRVAAQRRLPRPVRALAARLLFRAAPKPEPPADAVAWLRELYEPELRELDALLGRRMESLRG